MTDIADMDAIGLVAEALSREAEAEISVTRMRGRGRPRIYVTQADRQRAYRDRKRSMSA